MALTRNNSEHAAQLVRRCMEKTGMTPPRSRITVFAVRVSRARSRFGRELVALAKVFGTILLGLALFAGIQVVICKFDNPGRRLAGCLVPRFVKERP